LTRTLFLYQHDVRNGWFGDVSAVEPVTSSPNQAMVPAVRAPPQDRPPTVRIVMKTNRNARVRVGVRGSCRHGPGVPDAAGSIRANRAAADAHPRQPLRASETRVRRSNQFAGNRPPCPRRARVVPTHQRVTSPAPPHLPPVYMPPAFRAHQSITPAPPTIATHAREKKEKKS
jgi:hypothetical protein